MNESKIKARLTGAWVLAGIIALVGVGSAFNQYRLAKEQADWVSHTRSVQTCLSQIMSANSKAESCMRAFALTHDGTFLNARGAAVNELEHNVAEFAQLTRDNAVQISGLAKLRTLISKRFAQSKRFISLTKSGIAPQSMAALVHEGSGTTQEIEDQIASMQAEETRLLQIRSAKATDAIFEANLILAGISMFGAFCFCAAIWATVQYMRERSRLQARFRASFDQTFQYINLTTPTGEMIEANKNVLAFAHLNNEEIAGKMVWDMPWWPGDPEIKERVKAAVTEAASGKVVRFEALHVDPDKHPINVDVSVMPAFDDHQNLLFLMVEARDISERVKAENIIKLSERRLHSVLSSLAEGIYQVDAEGNLVFINAAAERMIQFEFAEIVGTNMHEVIHSKRPDGTPNPLESCPLLGVMRTGEEVRISEDHFQRKDGSFFPVEYVSSALHFDGTATGAVVAFQDITQRREAENRVSEFYSAVSHELRTPLTSIRGALRLLEGGKGGELSARAKQLVGMGRQECDRLVRLINDILDIRKIEAGKLELKLEKLEVKAVLTQTLETLSTLAAEHGVTLEHEIVDNSIFMADRDRLVQIITNLVSNAIKFSPKGGKVMTGVVGNAHSIRFEVHDEGPGISINDQQKLFKLFQQIDSSDARPKGGTGLGLAISKALVEMHGGTIGLNSVEGRGSTFWFQLPLRPSAENSGGEPANSTNPDRARPELLIVEDDDALSTLLHLSLVDQFIVKRVDSIRAAEDVLQESRPRAILMDLHLPDGTGVELIEKLRQSAHTRDIPVIVMSGSEPKIGKFTQPLVIDYLQKPFKETDLLESLGRAMSYKPRRHAQALVAEDDPAAQEVMTDLLGRIGVKCTCVTSGLEALDLLRSQTFDLLILDLNLPGITGDGIVSALKHEGNTSLPLLVYTAADLTAEEKARLTLGVTQHLTKSVASEEQFVESVRDLLKNLVSHEDITASSELNMAIKSVADGTK